MIINAVAFHNIGPFAGSRVVKLRHDVTVITGANDTGKSFFLKALALVGREDAPFLEPELLALANSGYVARESDWKTKGEIALALQFTGSDAGGRLDAALGRGSAGELRLSLMPDGVRRVLRPQPARASDSVQERGLGPRPVILRLPHDKLVREVIPRARPNAAEDRLLSIAFGQNYRDLGTPGTGAFHARVRRAQETLNGHLRRIAPREGLAFVLEASQESVFVHLHDQGGDMTPVSWRGTGIQYFISHLSGLLFASSLTTPVLILADEPELHLHADLQHSLRRLFEATAALEHVQVVYATHSPSMINNLRPDSVRLFRKETRDDRTAINVDSKPYHDNWLIVREGLGLTPADSLLYCSVTIVVEGVTELLCLPRLLISLERGGVLGFEDAERLLPLTHLLPAGGTGAEYLTRLAKSQRNQVIVLLDGDSRVVRAISDRHPEVPVVLLQDTDPFEIEDVVPLAKYVEAVASSVLPGDRARFSLANYEQWLEAHPQFLRMMTSKRVEEWISEQELEFEPTKQGILSIALSITPVPELRRLAPFSQLMVHLRAAFSDELRN